MVTTRHSNPLDADPGSAFGFRTSPLYPDSQQETGRFAAVTVLARPPELIVLGVLDGIWDRVPTLCEVRDRPVLNRSRFSFRRSPAVFATDSTYAPDLRDLTLLGVLPLTDEQSRFAESYASDRAVGRSYSTSTMADRDAEGEWRWAHDRESLLQEQAREDARRRLEQEAAAERYRTRLSGLTWQQLLAEDPFARWSPSPPFPPEGFRRAATTRVHETYRALQVLGDKPRKVAVRRELKSLVRWINNADAEAGYVIETEEREDICRVLDEITHVARQPSLMSEVDAWRDW